MVLRLTDSMDQSLLEKKTVAQLLKKFPTFYTILKFITVSTILVIGHYPQPDESSPHPITLLL
jgi:hypothetical protein